MTQADQTEVSRVMLEDVLNGLSDKYKWLPCKYFYDERGSVLFDQICELEEYYPTRTELEIMRDCSAEMATAIGPAAMIVEYGSGSSLKTRVLLDALINPAGYVPIDISREHLNNAAAAIADEYPGLDVRPLCCDYTRPFRLPQREMEEAVTVNPVEVDSLRVDHRRNGHAGDCNAVGGKNPLQANGSKEVSVNSGGRTVAYFPGSTIGNFTPDVAAEFLRNIRKTIGPGGALLIGVDLIKDPARLHAAYNDAAGVTAEFNLNILSHINRVLDTTFNVTAFAHYAYFNPRAGCMEMHLVSLADQRVEVGGKNFRVREGETIHTESCYKYTPHSFASLAADAGMIVAKVWLDRKKLFSVQWLTWP